MINLDFNDDTFKKTLVTKSQNLKISDTLKHGLKALGDSGNTMFTEYILCTHKT